jgi:hypothetical protein
MKLYKWEAFSGGWFIGNFEPTIVPSNDVEICIKRYNAGDRDQRHLHKVADEITMIIEGTVEMNNKKFTKNDIIWIEKGEASEFVALTDVVLCAVKLPCVKGDKYIV